MKASRKLLYFVSLVGLVAHGGPRGGPHRHAVHVAAARRGRWSSAAPPAAPGLVHRRAWPLALILLPLGAYLIARAQLPLPDSVHGLGDHIAFYRSQLRIGAGMYTTRHLPFDLRGAPELRLLLSLVVYLVAATASFVALSLRKALPAIVIALALLGFGLTIDQAGRVLWLPLVFLAMVGCVLALSRSLAATALEGGRRPRRSRRRHRRGAARALAAGHDVRRLQQAVAGLAHLGRQQPPRRHAARLRLDGELPDASSTSSQTAR